MKGVRGFYQGQNPAVAVVYVPYFLPPLRRVESERDPLHAPSPSPSPSPSLSLPLSLFLSLDGGGGWQGRTVRSESSWYTHVPSNAALYTFGPNQKLSL